MGRKSHLTLKEKKKVIDGLVIEKPERVIAKEIDRSKGAVHNVKENHGDEIRANKTKVLEKVGVDLEYSIGKLKTAIDTTKPKSHEHNLDMLFKIQGAYNPIQIDLTTEIKGDDKITPIEERIIEELKIEKTK